jgi:hypothetical protein
MNESSNNHARSSAAAAHLAVEDQLGPNLGLWKTLYLQDEITHQEKIMQNHKRSSHTTGLILNSSTLKQANWEWTY